MSLVYLSVSNVTTIEKVCENKKAKICLRGGIEPWPKDCGRRILPLCHCALIQDYQRSEDYPELKTSTSRANLHKMGAFIAKLNDAVSLRIFSSFDRYRSHFKTPDSTLGIPL